MANASTPRYFVAEYVNSPTDGTPRLIRTEARLLTLDDAESLTNRLNLAKGHRIVDEVEFVLSSPTAHYFMFDFDCSFIIS